MAARRVYLAQHGMAVDKAIDPERPLSEQGIAQTQAIAEQLQRANIKVTRIFHSGKLRARQTAEIFASVLAVDKLGSTEGFSPNDDVSQTPSQLTFDDALYIGHLPHLDKLVSLLVSGDEASGVLMFQNSAIVCLKNETSKDNYSIQWYLSNSLISH